MSNVAAVVHGIVSIDGAVWLASIQLMRDAHLVTGNRTCPMRGLLFVIMNN